MTHVIRTTTCAALMVCTSIGTAAAESSETAEQIVHLADGVVLGVSVEGAPDTWASRPDVGTRAADGMLHRLLVDHRQIARFAYALAVEPAGDGAVIVVQPVRLHETIAAYSSGVRTFDLPFRLEGSVPTLDDAQSSGTLNAGDVLRLDTVEHADTGIRLTDVIRIIELDPAAVRATASRRAAATGTRPTLTVAGPEIRRDDVLIHRTSPGNLATGYALIIALPVEGTLAFSVTAASNETPVAVATLHGPQMRFSLDGHDYQVTGTEPIGPPDVTTLWVYRLGGWFSPRGLPSAPGVWLGAGNEVDRMRANFGAALPAYEPATGPVP